MNIVALYGNGGSGKTTVLKLLLARVLEECKGVTVSDTSVKNISPALLRKQIDFFESEKAAGRDYEEHDVYAVLEFTDGRKVGITTKGNSEWDLRVELERFSDCDLIFCAALSKGETLARLRKAAKGGTLVLHRQHQVTGYGVKSVKERIVRANLSMVKSLAEEL